MSYQTVANTTVFNVTNYVTTGSSICVEVVTSVRCLSGREAWDGLWHLPAAAPVVPVVPPRVIHNGVRRVRPQHFRHVRCQQRRGT